MTKNKTTAIALAAATVIITMLAGNASAHDFSGNQANRGGGPNRYLR